MMGRAEISLRGADLLVRLMFSFLRAGEIICGIPQSTPVYEGRQLHFEEVDVDPVEPGRKQDRLPILTKWSEMFRVSNLNVLFLPTCKFMRLSVESSTKNENNISYAFAKTTRMGKSGGL